jgi:hypothetical protein
VAPGRLGMAQAGVVSREAPGVGAEQSWGGPFRIVELPVISGDKPNRTIASALISRSAAHDRRPYAEWSLEVPTCSFAPAI